MGGGGTPTIGLWKGGGVAARHGTLLTFCFTDIEGSTSLLARLGEAEYGQMLRVHRRLLRAAWTAHGGAEQGTEGDSFFVVFKSAASAAEACVQAQAALASQAWPAGVMLRVRMGLHSGEASLDPEGGYRGLAIHQAARVAASAHGGQVVVSAKTAEALQHQPRPIGLRALGRHRLRDFPDAVELWQLTGDHLGTEFPPLRGAGALEPFAAIRPPSWLVAEHSDALAGRADELAVLSGAVEDALAGRRRCVFVAGEPGVGKTRLVAEAARAARARGLLVLAGRCDSDLPAPYGPFTEALRQVVLAVEPGALGECLGRWPGELVRLVPELADVIPGLEPPTVSDYETERWRLFDAVASAIATLGAPGGLVLVVDDLQWASAASLALLAHLMRTETTLRLVVLATFRDTEVDRNHPLAGLLAGLSRLPDVQRLSLRGLNEVAIGELIETAIGKLPDASRAAFSQRLTQATAGNPFFAGEVLRHLIASGDPGLRDGAAPDVEALELPMGVRELILRRVDSLGPGGDKILGVASVVGAEFDLALLAAVTGVDEDGCLDVLERAASGRLVVEVDDDSWRFAHALVRAALYDELSSTRRSRTHRKVANSLEATSHPEPALLAHHWALASGEDAADRAKHWSRRAGDQAMDRLAPDQAAFFYAKALELAGPDRSASDDLDLLIRLGVAQRQAGTPEFRQTLLDAARAAQLAGDSPRLVSAVLANTHGYFSVPGGIDVERVELLEAALASTPTVDSPEQARLLALLCCELSFRAPVRRRQELGAAARTVARRLGDPATFVMVSNLLDAPWFVPSLHHERLADTAEALAVAEQLGDPSLLASAVACRSGVAFKAGLVEEVDRCLEIMSSLDERANPATRHIARNTSAVRRLLAGDHAEAERLADRALDVGIANGQPGARVAHAFQMMGVRWQQGRMSEVVPMLEQAIAANPGVSLSTAALLLSFCETDRYSEAASLLSDATNNRFASVPEDVWWLSTLTMYAEAAVVLRSPVPAAALLDLLRPWHALIAFGKVTLEGPVSHYLGGLAGVLSRHRESEAYFAEAAAASERLGARFFSARTDLAAATMLASRPTATSTDRQEAQRLATRALTRALPAGYLTVERRSRVLLTQLDS